MPTPRLLPLALIGALACNGPSEQATVAGVQQAMAEQQAAWDRGDILGFMDAYADTVCFISPKGRTCGKKAVTANYIRSYPDSTAMGKLTFDHLEVLPTGSAHAWCTGRWRLERVSDTLAGGFSLLWRQVDGQWSIVRDHTY